MTNSTFAGNFTRAAEFLKSDGAGVLEALGLVTSYLKVREEEESRRAEIRMERDIAVAKILSQRDVILRYFDATFKERETSLDHFYSLLRQASENGDDHRLECALRGIVGIVTSSPLLGFKDFWAAYDAGGVEL